jgi:hypothetical protein
MYLREPVLPALLGRLKGNSLPFCPLLCRALGVKVYHGASRKEGEDLRRANFDRFLHDVVHVFPLGYGLGKGDASLQWRGDGLVQNVQPDRGGIERGDLGDGFASPPIEKGDAIARLKPEHAAGVVRLGAG